MSTERSVPGLRSRTIPIVMSLALVVAACSPPTSSETEPDEAATDETADASDEDIVIGAPMPLTGGLASDGEEMEQALELAIEDYNEAGGLLGRQIVLRTCDVAAMEVDIVQACAERLLGENPHAIITGYGDSGASSTFAFGEADMPYLHAVTHWPAVEPVAENPEEFSNVFQYDPSEIDYGIDAAERLPEIAAEIGVDLDANPTVAVVSADYAYNLLAAERFKEDMEATGYEIVVDEVTPFGVEEWGPVISNIRSAEPGIISFWNLSPADAARFMSQLDRVLDEDGMETVIYFQYTPSIPEFLELAGDSAEGMVWSTVLGVSDLAVDSQEYGERFAERFGDEPQSIHGYVVRDAFDIWANAVEEAGCVDCFDEVNDNIRESEHAGFAGNYRFAPADEGQYAMRGDDLIPTIWSQVQDGNNVRIYPTAVGDAQLQAPPWLP